MENSDVKSNSLNGTKEHPNRFFCRPYDIKNEKVKEKPKDVLKNSELL